MSAANTPLFSFILLTDICTVNDMLNNPVYNALLTGDAQLGTGTDKARYFDKEVSPFASFEEGYTKGFDDLYDLLPHDRLVLYPTPRLITGPKGWQLLEQVEGLQMVFDKGHHLPAYPEPVPLETQHIDQMVQLATLTKPGPFGPRTIEFGHYFGFFQGEQLIAMTGQRLHPGSFTEISAVCTHPDHLGKGLASALIYHQLDLISDRGQTPFLHVRADNERAIEIYKRLGFSIRSAMNFYVLKK